MPMKQAFQMPPPVKKGWVAPALMVYGDMTALTQQCLPDTPGCKPKVLGMGDDFSNNISTLGE